MILKKIFKRVYNHKKIRRWVNRVILHRFNLHLVNILAKKTHEEIDRYDFQDQANKYIEIVKGHTMLSP
ncbi:MAG: hypothetical protein OEU95_05635, partial [Nitrospirota bacterium]|nr:hypothetical protein [Nitrospirota bacterium]